MKKFQTIGLWYDAWRRLKNDKVAMISLFIVIVFTLLAIYGELVYQYHNALDLTPNYQKTNLEIFFGFSSRSQSITKINSPFDSCMPVNNAGW